MVHELFAFGVLTLLVGWEEGKLAKPGSTGKCH